MKLFKKYDAILKKRMQFRTTIREQFNNRHIAKFLNESVDINLTI